MLEVENFAAWEIFRVLAAQLRLVGISTMESSQIVVAGVDFSAVPLVLDSYGVPHSERLFVLDKLVLLNSLYVSAQNRKKPEKTGRDKKV